MRNRLVASLIAALVVLAASVGVSVAAGPAPEARNDAKGGPHNIQTSLSAKQSALKQRALEMKLRGQANADAKVVEVAKGQYVELAREATDPVFVVIADFGTLRHPSYCDAGQSCAFPADGSAATYDGPAHNAIPQPDRATDNTTLWQSDFNKAHYEDMYFNRMAAYYESQSSGRYSVQGAVTEWVRVPFNEARYGRNFCGGIVCANTWFLIRDAMAIWVKAQKDAGMTDLQIKDYLKTFDVWDRYDHDGDGNFDEQDGYIDHFQIVHAGGDEAAGDPSQGTDAIWSHRWYVQLNAIGSNGPDLDGDGIPDAPFGGIDAGSNAGGGTGGVTTFPNNPTGVWVGDYTIQPENGGLGVFVHEYGHDLGLPDLYDTSGNTGGAENSTGFWTLMSSGANIGNGGPDGIGDQPTDLGAWEKFQLGWLGCGACPGGRFYEVAIAGQRSEHKLGPANSATKQAQALFVVLPDKQVTVDLGAPYAGSKYYYSGQGDDLDHLMYRSFAVSGGTLAAKVRYDIELDWDYAYAVVSTDGGAHWTNLDTSVSSHTDPNGQNFGNGITGSSGGNWVDLSASLAGYAGNVLIGFRYWTDGAVVNPGFQVDEIAVTGSATDGAETDTGWTFAPAGGFRVTTGQEQSSHFNAYVAEYRGYRGYDTSLRTAYNFGFLDSRPDWVEFFPYQDGLLVSYWDESQSDNGVGDHPGSGLILPVDAHPSLHAYQDGTLVRPRILSYDSTFGLEPTDAITVNRNSQPITIPSQPAAPVFDDTKSYWVGGPAYPGRYQPGWASVDVPKTGTAIRVKSTSAQGNFMEVQVLRSSDVARGGKGK